MALSFGATTEVVPTNGTHNWFGRSVLFEHSDVLFHFYRSGNSHSHRAGDVLHVRTSTNEGVTWGNEDKWTDGSAISGFPITANNVTMGAEDMYPVVHSDGSIWLLTFERDDESPETQAGPYAYKSIDNGQSWSLVGKVTGTGIDDNVVPTFGMSINGTTYFCAWYSEGGGAHFVDARSLLLKAVDNDPRNIINFADVTTDVEDACNEWSGAYIPSRGEIVGIFRNITADKTYLRWSTSNLELGDTWGTLQDITHWIPAVGRPSLRYYESDNLLVLHSRKSIGVQPAGVAHIAFSRDLGVTWHSRHPVGTATNDGGYGDFYRRSDGSIFLASYVGTFTGPATIYQYEMTHKFGIMM